ncbi:MAG: hypothetical protein NVSMB66_4470 [Candidatus Doudnabacteria bacterium]
MDKFITGLSLFFIKRARLTILIGIFLLVFGFLSFSTFLKREGFPAVQVPVVSIQTNYFAGDPNKVNQDITEPIENSLNDIADIKEIRSFTGDNFSYVTVTFQENVDLQKSLESLKGAVSSKTTLPATSKTTFQTFDGGRIDSKHDLLIALVANKPTTELQNKAKIIAAQLSDLSNVNKAESVDLITSEKNPRTGEAFQNQSKFNHSAYKVNGKLEFQSAVSIGVNGKKDISSTKLSEQVREKLSQLADQGELKDYSIVYSGDPSIALNKQLKSLENNALSGVLIILLVLFLFINWRTAIVLAIFLPLTLGSVFLSLYLLHYSLNTISLFALILVLGIFVDDGTIVVEAIDYYRNQGLGKIESIKAAIDDIGVADVAGTLTTVLVFVPMMFISGILGKFIFLIPVTIVLAMSISVIIALAILPLISSWLIREKTFSILGKLVSKSGQYLARFTGYYLNSKLRSAVVLIVSLLIIGGGAFFASKVQFSVFPAAKDTPEIMVSMEFPTGSDFQKSEELSKSAEQIISNEGSGDIVIANYITADKNNATILVELENRKNRSETSQKLIDRLNEKFKDLSFKASATALGAGPPTEKYPFKLQLFSNDLNNLTSSANDISAFLKNQNFPNNVSISEIKISNLDSISKINKRRYVEISAKYNGAYDTSTILKTRDIIQSNYSESKLSSMHLAKDALGFNFGQESQNLESFQSTITALIFALMLIYALLLLQFNSFSKPILILLAIPFALPGVFPGLYYTHNALSFFSILGIIALAGIVVNNSIMLLQYAEHAKAEGKNSKEAIIQAIRIRFRPIITTSITTIGGLLPLGLTDPFWESLTFSIIFGLLSSVVLILFAFPVYYIILEAGRTKVHRWLHIN